MEKVETKDAIGKLIDLIKRKLTLQEILNHIKTWEDREQRKKASKLIFRLGDCIDEMKRNPALTFGGQKKLIKKYKLQVLKDVFT